MKRLIAAACAAGLGAGAAGAEDITLQLKWVTQAQFAGYYVALEKVARSGAAGGVLSHDHGGPGVG